MQVLRSVFSYVHMLWFHIRSAFPLGTGGALPSLIVTLPVDPSIALFIAINRSADSMIILAQNTTSLNLLPVLDHC